MRADAPADPRALAVAGRDFDDRFAAALATLLAPCVLCTSDKDFAALGVIQPGDPLGAVAASQGMVMSAAAVVAPTGVAAAPVAGIVAGLRWIASGGAPPLLVYGGAAALAIFVYHRLGPERQAALRRFVGEAATELARQTATNLESFDAHERALYERVVLPTVPLDRESVVLRRLACTDKPLSAQRIWERLDPVLRPAVTDVRELLRTNPACCPAGRGIYTFGELLVAPGRNEAS